MKGVNVKTVLNVAEKLDIQTWKTKEQTYLSIEQESLGGSGRKEVVVLDQAHWVAILDELTIGYVLKDEYRDK